MVKSRRGGARNWARGLFAFFWIVLAGFSGLYLFNVFTDPAALGGQAAQLSALARAEAPADTAPAAVPAPVSPGTSQASDKELTEIKSSLRALSQQMAELDTRLKPIENFVGPVAALPGSTSVTAPMASEPAPPAAPAEEEKPVEPEATQAEETPAPAPAPQVAAPKPTPKPKPMASEPAPPAAPPEEPKPQEQASTTATPAETPADEDEAEAPAATAEAPANDEPEQDGDASATADDAPSPAEAFDSASLDATSLPPAANDGTTRFGIEIGSVAKRAELRPLWRQFLTDHAALVAGLQPRRVLAPDKKWRLIAGPFANAREAEGACALFKKADRPCEATVYAGDTL